MLLHRVPDLESHMLSAGFHVLPQATLITEYSSVVQPVQLAFQQQIQTLKTQHEEFVNSLTQQQHGVVEVVVVVVGVMVVVLRVVVAVVGVEVVILVVVVVLGVVEVVVVVVGVMVVDRKSVV